MPAWLRRRLRSFARLAAASVLVLADAAPARADEKPRMFDDYLLTSWTESDGLFGGWIVGIAQDRHGYLWLATVSGLIRFDGVTFERFRSSDGTRLPQRSLSSIYAARDGSVWVGFTDSGGVCRIDQGRVRDFGRDDGLGGGRVTGLLEDADGSMLAATREGLFRLVGDRFERVGSEYRLPEGHVHAAYMDRSSALWVSTLSGVFRRNRGESQFEYVAGPTRHAPSFSASTDGVMWVTDRSAGFTRLDARDERSRSQLLHQGNGYRLLHDRSGNLWVATVERGLWFVRNTGSGFDAPDVVRVHDGLSSDSVQSLFEDRDGSIWVGTTSGLHRFARRRVTAITDLGVVRAVHAARDGSIWVGTANGLVRFSREGRRRYGTEDGLPSADVRALHVDRSGTLWVGTTVGIAVFAGDRLSPLPLESGTWPTGIYIITTDASGTLWIGHQDHGLLRWRNGHLTAVHPSAEVDSSTVKSVASDSQGRLWVILEGGGLGLLDPAAKFQLVRRGDDFRRHDLAVYEDASGAVWFGGGDRLTRFRGGRLESLDSTNGLPAEAIRAIAGDADGYLWVGTSAGVIRLAPGEFDAAVADPARQVEFRSYDSSDGMAGIPIRTGYSNATRDSDGRLWFVTGGGLSVVEPRRLSVTRPAPPARIERVTANGRSFEPAGAFTLPPRTTSLEIDYTALAFASPRQVRFRYRLDGLETAWTDAGTRRQVSYTNLPPGSYRFQVIARSNEGVWDEQGHSLGFSIEPAFYQTRWFLACCTVAALGLVLVGWRIRLRHIHHEFALVLAERARVAREIHDTLLQSLAGLELQVDAMSTQLDASAGPVKQQLERARRQIQRDVSEARQSIWDLRSPTLETRDLASALRELGEGLAAANGVRFEFEVDGRSPRRAAKVEEHLLRIGREAISNAVRHARATVVRMELRYERDTIVMRVSDDGRGFDVVEATRTGGSHWGLTAMQERAQAIGGRLTLMSRPGGGTAVEMTAPLLS